MAQLRERIQWLHPGIALSIDNPGGVALNILILADFRLRRIGAAGTALDVRNTTAELGTELALSALGKNIL